MLFAAAWFVVIGIVALACWMIWDARQLAWRQAIQSSENLIATLARDLDRVVAGYDLSLQAVTDGLKLAETRTVSGEARQLILFDRAASAGQFGVTRVLDDKGQIVFDSSTVDPPPANLADRDYFRFLKAHTQTDLFIGAPFRAGPKGEWEIALARRIESPEGRFAGVVAGSLRLDYVRELFQNLTLDVHGAIALFRNDGTLLMRNPFDDREIGRVYPNAATLRHLREAPFGHFEDISAVDGTRRLFTYRQIAGLPLVVVFGKSSGAILAEWWQRGAIIGVVMIGFAGIALWLGVALSAELRRRGKAERTASESERRYRLLAENANDVIMAIDEDRMPRYVSPASREALGYASEELIGMPFVAFLHAADATRVATLLDEIEHNGVGGATAIDTHRLRRKDGSYVWIEAAFRLAVDPERGATHEFVAALRDVSARKAAEDELAEKNATLSAILREMPDGVQVFDRHGRMVANNSQLFQLVDFTPEERDRILASPDPGRAFRYALATRGDYGIGDPDELVAGREATARAGRPIHFRRRGDSGRWLDVRGVPTADGGWLAQYRDVSEEVAREHELRDASERLEEQATTLCATAEDLARARETAEDASRSKSVFLANMSHELRTPLNGVIGFADLMMKETFGPLGHPRYAEYARDIAESGRHLLQLINDILDFSKIEAGRLELQEDDIDLFATVSAAVRMVRARADETGLVLSLRNELPSEVLGLRADERRVKQIVLNLVSNAVKFTEPGGRVTLSVAAARTPDEGGVIIAVKDTGIGIAAEDLSRVMEAFSQIDHGLNRRQDGTGLGLPLTRRLVELHQGELRLESTPGTGTNVTVWFPAARVLRAAQACEHSDGDAAARPIPQAIGRQH